MTGFNHYLAYGATDQETFRDLRDFYDGVLVPATIAAYQRKGTGGFVLSLSATEQAPPYVIDSRFPLFQQTLDAPKKSHTALAGLLDDPGLVRTLTDPRPEEFPDDRLEEIAKRWVEFNVGYGEKENATFDKYAKRLGLEDVRPEKAQNPEAVLAPYFACLGPEDPWWARSKRFFEFTSAATTGVPCRRVVCAREPEVLDSLLGDLEPEELVVWVSDLDEHQTAATHLIAYRRAIANAAQRGHEPFALYGGFFAVLLGSAGLRGASHGVGFSEHRAWKELPSSGAAPARFYMRRLHRYVPQDLAQALYDVGDELTECPCEFCAGRPPIALGYHDLMKHSVWCRNEEIKRWYLREPEEAAEELGEEFDTISAWVGTSGLPPAIRARARSVLEHLPEWVNALRADV